MAKVIIIRNWMICCTYSWTTSPSFNMWQEILKIKLVRIECENFNANSKQDQLTLYGANRPRKCNRDFITSWRICMDISEHTHSKNDLIIFIDSPAFTGTRWLQQLFISRNISAHWGSHLQKHSINHKRYYKVNYSNIHSMYIWRLILKKARS
jgi:hypothetical protein